jgi:uncharacterized protein (DUF1330 family)
MPAFVIFDVDIKDPTRYQEFMTGVKPALEQAGAKYLARGGATKSMRAIGGRAASSCLSFPPWRRGRRSTTARPIGASRASGMLAAPRVW